MTLRDSLQEQAREAWARLEAGGSRRLMYVRIPVPAESVTLADVPNIPEGRGVEIEWSGDQVCLVFYKRSGLDASIKAKNQAARRVRSQLRDDRARLAYRMRSEGATYRVIGEQLGVSASRAGDIFLYGQWLMEEAERKGASA